MTSPSSSSSESDTTELPQYSHLDTPPTSLSIKRKLFEILSKAPSRQKRGGLQPSDEQQTEEAKSPSCKKSLKYPDDNEGNDNTDAIILPAVVPLNQGVIETQASHVEIDDKDAKCDKSSQTTHTGASRRTFDASCQMPMCGVHSTISITPQYTFGYKSITPFATSGSSVPIVQSEVNSANAHARQLLRQLRETRLNNPDKKYCIAGRRVVETSVYGTNPDLEQQQLLDRKLQDARAEDPLNRYAIVSGKVRKLPLELVLAPRSAYPTYQTPPPSSPPALKPSPRKPASTVKTRLSKARSAQQVHPKTSVDKSLNKQKDAANSCTKSAVSMERTSNVFSSQGKREPFKPIYDNFKNMTASSGVVTVRIAPQPVNAAPSSSLNQDTAPDPDYYQAHIDTDWGQEDVDRQLAQVF
jgi:hypothetical protein